MDGLGLEAKRLTIFSAAAVLCVAGYMTMGYTFTRLVAYQVVALERTEQGLGLQTGAQLSPYALPSCGTNAEVARIRGATGAALSAAVAAACQGDPALVVQSSTSPPR